MLKKIGLLIVASLFVIAILSWKTGFYYEHCEQIKPNQEPCPLYNLAPFILLKIADFLERFQAAFIVLATVAIAWFTYELRAATISLDKSTKKLWRAGKKQYGVVKQAADAATSQAKTAESALTDLETPFIYPVIKKDDFKEAFMGFVKYAETTTDTAQPIITFTLKNYGRTPALLQSVAAVSDHFTKMPEKPRVDILADYAVDYILPVGEETKKTFSKEVRIPIDLMAYKSIKANNSRIFLYGEIKFTDVFGNSYIQSFCLASDYAGKGFIPWGAEYNKRERHKNSTDSHTT